MDCATDHDEAPTVSAAEADAAWCNLSEYVAAHSVNLVAIPETMAYEDTSASAKGE